MKIFAVIILALLFVSCSNQKKEQLNTLEDILQAHLKAIGSDNIENMQTMLHRDRLSTTPDGKAASEIEVMIKKPDSYYYKSVDAEDTIIIGNFKNKNWAYIQKEFKQRPADKNNQAAFNMYAYGFAPLFYAKLNSYPMEYTGKTEFNGKELYRIKVTQPKNGDDEGDNIFYYDIDPDDFMIVRMANNGITQYYSDFKDAKGIKYAAKISSDAPGVKPDHYFRGEIVEFKVDIELPDVLFDPSSVLLKK